MQGEASGQGTARVKGTAEKTVSPWPRVFAIVTAFLAVFLFFLFRLVYQQGSSAQEPWLKELHTFLVSQKTRSAMTPISEAFEGLDWESLHRQKKAMRELAITGWKGENEAIIDVLERNAALVPAVAASAEIGDVVFPLTKDRGIEAPRPPFELLETVAYFLTTNARMLEWRGRVDDAMLRMSETALLGMRFCRPRDEACLNGHLAGLAMIDLSSNGMTRILSRDVPGDQTLAMCYERLTKIDRDLPSIAEALEADADVFANELLAHGNSPAQMASVLQFYNRDLSEVQAAALAKDLGADIPTFKEEHGKLWGEVGRVLRLPFPTRPLLDAKWLKAQTPNRLARMYFPDVQTLAVRETVTRARVRLLRALCLEALGRDAEARALRDPFSGMPFQWTDKGVYSLGPDARDDGGVVLYEPTRGVSSAGDVVAYFPPRMD